MAQTKDCIEVHGARTHNLRAIDTVIPRGALVVLTGVSGSGKSSLAFDTIFAEGQRRYLESASPHLCRLLDTLPRPDVDRITGLPPTLSITQQGNASKDPRSIVATLTEIHDHLRLLYARCGTVFCYRCGAPIGTQTVKEIVADVASLGEGRRLHILAPLALGRKGQLKDNLALIRREGFLRARLDGQIVLLDQLPQIDPSKPHDLEMVVDRQVLRPGISDRLAESIQTALKHGDGTVLISSDDSGAWEDRAYSTLHACRHCGISYRELAPRTFSFNSPYGACPTCQGLGRQYGFDFERVIPDPSLSVAQGAVAPFRTKSGALQAKFRQSLEGWRKEGDWDHVPVAELPAVAKELLWEGGRSFAGVRRQLEQLSQASDADEDQLAEYRNEQRCPDCAGARLGPVGRSVKIAGLTLPELTALSIDAASERLAHLQFSKAKRPLAAPILHELRSRLVFLRRVGVGYVELDRPVGTLSGGEYQRARLTGCLGSGLNGVCYVLDEPTIGLHARDAGRLLDVLEELRDQDNTVLLVEHDELAIGRADHVIDLGPGAGRHGGQIVGQGSWDELIRGSGLTADYLARRRRVDALDECKPFPDSPSPARPEADHTAPSPSSVRSLTVHGARHHNLANVTVSFPLGRLTAVTGVSGSGKSSLVIDILTPAVRRALRQGGRPPGTHERLTGTQQLARIVEVDQHPIGRTPRSTPAVFVGIMEPIRRVFAKTRDARARGFRASRFSFNNRAGQCPQCKGLGASQIEMGLLESPYVPCPACRGRRFNRATLEVKYRGKSIADVLAMSVEETADFFCNHARVARIARTLGEIGLGYLVLDQWSTTLSAGEAQRVKLGAELGRPETGQTLYVLDEPTTGLHFHDVAQLLRLLRRLVEAGNTVIVIEHHLDLIGAADWIVDLGPEGGAGGGHVVCEGTPQLLMSCAESFTGQALRARGRPR